MTGVANPNFEFDCATIQVPQDWHNKDNGKTFDIALVRARSNTQHDRIGSLVVNPGGPGGSGIQLAAGLVAPGQKFPTAITDRFDLVGFDPRGVGQSTEVECITPTAEDCAVRGGSGSDVAGRLRQGRRAQQGRRRALRRRSTARQLPLFSTEQAARDIDAVRVAVGDPKLTYLGYSYGTLLGAVYAQIYPQNVRAAVLDGAIDPKQDVVARSEGQAAGFEHAFDDFSTWCTGERRRSARSRTIPVARSPARLRRAGSTR